jgi:ABC-type multidrug transport system fused ATPase/permease subunit
VLDSGLLAEMDSPEALLNKEGGLFKSLWERHQKSHQH